MTLQQTDDRNSWLPKPEALHYLKKSLFIMFGSFSLNFCLSMWSCSGSWNMDLIDTWIITKILFTFTITKPFVQRAIGCNRSFNLSINNNIHSLNLFHFGCMQSNSFQNTFDAIKSTVHVADQEHLDMGHVRFVSVPLCSCIPIENGAERKKNARLSIHRDTPALLLQLHQPTKKSQRQIQTIPFCSN